MNEKINELIERLEKATGPDRELDDAVLRACGWDRVESTTSGLFFWERPGGQMVWEDERPCPTSSVDAALTLVPEGRTGSVCFYQDGGSCELFPTNPGDNGGPYAEAKTPAIALCIAALKARAHG